MSSKFFSAEKARSGMIHFRSSFLHQSNYFDVLLSEPRISSLGFEPNHIFHICVLPRWTSELPLNPEIPYDSIPENRAYDSRPKEDWNLMGLAAMAGRSLFLQQVLDLPLPYRKLDLIYRASQRGTPGEDLFKHSNRACFPNILSSLPGVIQWQ